MRDGAVDPYEEQVGSNSEQWIAGISHGAEQEFLMSNPLRKIDRVEFAARSARRKTEQVGGHLVSNRSSGFHLVSDNGVLAACLDRNSFIVNWLAQPSSILRENISDPLRSSRKSRDA